MFERLDGSTGRVQRFEIAIDPLRDDLLLGQLIEGSVEPGQFAFYPLDLPTGVTNLNFLFTVDGALEFYWREEALPSERTELQLTVDELGRDILVYHGRDYEEIDGDPDAYVLSVPSQQLATTEAYLDTARRRISVRRHVRLVDYPMHDGCNARAGVSRSSTWRCRRCDMRAKRAEAPGLPGSCFIMSFQPM